MVSVSLPPTSSSEHRRQKMLTSVAASVVLASLTSKWSLSEGPAHACYTHSLVQTLSSHVSVFPVSSEYLLMLG